MSDEPIFRPGQPLARFAGLVGLFVFGMAVLLWAGPALAASDVVKPGISAPFKQTKTTTVSASQQQDRVDWNSLTTLQKTELAPLAADWASIEGNRQQKWLEMAGRMAALPAADRARIQRRMTQWSQLTPEKRGQARQQFLEAKQLPAPQRQARWEEYQALSPEQKGKLAAQARTAPDKRPAASTTPQALAAPTAKLNTVTPSAISRPKVTTPTLVQANSGATTRALTSVPNPPAHHLPGMPKIVASDDFVDPTTMLPKRGPQGAAVRSSLTEKSTGAASAPKSVKTPEEK